MTTNVMIIYGSSRKKGNSTLLGRSFFQGLNQMGIQVSEYHLSKMKYRGCIACMRCKDRLDHCALNDDLTEVLASIVSSDIIILASPVYFADLASSVKAMFDRFYSFYQKEFWEKKGKTRLPLGKQFVLILAQGDIPEKYADISKRYFRFLKEFGFQSRFLVRCCGIDMSKEGDEQTALYSEVNSILHTIKMNIEKSA